MLMTLLGAATLAAWIYLLAFRGGFWRIESARATEAAQVPASPLPSVVAVIPARNEADVGGQAIRSLAAQNYAGQFHIVLVDDSSSDGTADAARAAAGADLLTVVRAAPLAEGWTGKLWAVSQGVAVAERRAPEFLLLTDADIAHAPSNLTDLVERAVRDGYDLVSYMARLRCCSAAEHALMPAFVFFFFLLYPPAWIRNPRRAAAGAAGGCMLVRREALEAIGGIGAIRGAWIDDCALAAAIKRRGGRVWLGASEPTRSLRGYASFGEAGRMISRSAFTQLHHSAWLLAAAVAGLLLTYAAPPALTLGAHGGARWLGAAAWLVMAFCYWPAVRFFGRPAYEAAALPLVALFYLGATIHSAWQWWRGAGAQWKGRSQPVSSSRDAAATGQTR
jgi:hopene-associated glycosyltransferase HpnB